MSSKKSRFFIPKKYIPFFKNKYFLTLLGFVVWLSFFDRNDFITTSSYRKMLVDLKKEKEYYEVGIKKNTEDLKNLLTNHENLEKYGRENYLMKKDDEDIYVVVTDSIKN